MLAVSGVVFFKHLHEFSLSRFLQLSTRRYAMENKTKKVLGILTTNAVLSPLGFRLSIFYSSMSDLLNFISVLY